jgi:hypothetical protein
MGTYMYMEKKMARGFTMAKEKTRILCHVAMLMYACLVKGDILL